MDYLIYTRIYQYVQDNILDIRKILATARSLDLYKNISVY